ncbi:10361_t:CDS:1, partial [Entrophospora sp. SA101]
DMLKELQRLVETDEIEAKNNPSLQHHKRLAVKNTYLINK